MTVIPRRIGNNCYAKFWEMNKTRKVHYGQCENGKREAVLPHAYPKSPLVPLGIPHGHSIIIMTKKKTHDNQA